MLAKETFKYDSKGRVATQKEYSYEDGNTYTYTYKYDKKNQVIERLCKGGQSDYAYANTYKSGRLAKQVCTDSSDGSTVDTKTFKYKKVYVPKALVKMVKAQQQAIIGNVLPIESAHK